MTAWLWYCFTGGGKGGGADADVMNSIGRLSGVVKCSCCWLKAVDRFWGIRRRQGPSSGHQMTTAYIPSRRLAESLASEVLDFWTSDRPRQRQSDDVKRQRAQRIARNLASITSRILPRMSSADWPNVGRNRADRVMHDVAPALDLRVIRAALSGPGTS